MAYNIRIGCVADDFTGASDAASFLQKRGLRTMLCTGIPDRSVLSGAFDAVVIALKTRSVPSGEAVADSLDAMQWLLAAGAGQLYLKYCSTFDSTREGNIGPVLDAALERFGLRYTLLCPALPVNGRTVVNGRLYVNGVPLHETHMRYHPLNPMWDSELAILMREQSKYPCFVLTAEEMHRGEAYVKEKISALASSHAHFYIVPDYYEDSHAELIYSLFGGLKLLSGGSGLLGNRLIQAEQSAVPAADPTPAGKTLLLSGSCSKVTLEQLRQYEKTGNRMIKILPEKVLCGEQSWETLWECAKGLDGVMLYSSDTPEALSSQPQQLRGSISAALEETMAKLAQAAVAGGYTQIIVAGGETSGAVTGSLGFGSYIIGESIAPGVPVMIPVENRRIRLVLKSGNFGQPDFFERAVKLTAGGNRGA